jgi:hypothetical protein
MSNFIWNDLPLLDNGPKSDLTPEPIGADPTKWVDATDWNALRQALLDIQTVLTTPGVPNPASIAAFGAIPSKSIFTETNGASNAIDAALQASGFGSGNEAFVPPGDFVISRPICLPGHAAPQTWTLFHGQSAGESRLWIGAGTSTSPNLVQGFAGPMIISVAGGSDDTFPGVSYGAPLVGGVGQSLVATYDQAFWLHDAWAWTAALNTLSALSVQLWFNGTSFYQGNQGGFIIGSKGPPASGIPYGAAQNQCFGIYATPSGIGFTLSAYFTTQTTPTVTLTNGTVYTFGTSYNLELDYDGANVWFYVNGVHQAHAAATGVVYRLPWEAVAFNFGSPEWYLSGPPLGMNANYDSIRLSQVARNTGTGSFTPPVAKYTWDANTLGLINFDQGAPPGLCANANFIMGQAAFGSASGYVPHFIRYTRGQAGEPSGSSGVALLRIEDLTLGCLGYIPGIVQYQTSRSRVKRLFIYDAGMYGILSADTGSYWNEYDDIYIDGSSGTGMCVLALRANNVSTTNCRIGQQYFGGIITDCTDQAGGASIGPPYWQNAASMFPFIFGPTSEGYFSTFLVQGCGNDSEGFVSTMQAAMLVWGIETAVFQNNVWQSGYSYWTTTGDNSISNPTTGTPCVAYLSIPPSGVTHIGDVFAPSALSPWMLYKSPYATGFANLIDCEVPTFVINNLSGSPVPLFNGQGWVVQKTPTQANNQQGISVSDIQANNLTGTFTIKGGTTVISVQFLVPEPDGNFTLWFQSISSTGSPAVNSTHVHDYAPNADGTGFTGHLEADPGAGVFITFAYWLCRTFPPPLYSSFTPTLPSTINPNPLVAVSPTGDFVIATTLVPTNGKNFVYNSTPGTEVAFQWGAPTTNWCDCALVNGCEWYIAFANGVGYAGLVVDSWVSGNGKLCGLLNPGTHNVVAAKQGGLWTPQMDGGVLPYPVPVSGLTGTEQSPIYVGQNSSAGQLLSSAALRDFKIDTLLARAVTSEPDYGPNVLPQYALFGDSFTVGLSSSSSIGGWASQVVTNRFGSKYYWMACSTSARAVQMVATSWPLAGSLGGPFWTLWGQNKTSILQGVCVFIGFYDLLYDGASATTVWNAILGMLQGSQATAYFLPNTAGTATCVINGVSFNSVFNTNATTTVNNLVSTINASAPTNTIVTASLDTSFGIRMKLTAVALGPSGNGISLSTNGVSGAAWQNALGYALTATAGAGKGLMTLPVPKIVLCTVPPFGNSPSYTVGKDTQRTTLNSTITAYVAGSGGVLTLADVDVTLRDPAAHQNILAAYLAADNETLTNAGHTAMYGLINPLLP